MNRCENRGFFKQERFSKTKKNTLREIWSKMQNEMFGKRNSFFFLEEMIKNFEMNKIRLNNTHFFYT